MSHRLTAALLLAASALATAPAAHAATARPSGPGCDRLDDSACLLPFPNDAFTRSDRRSPTGRVLALRDRQMPRNAAVQIGSGCWLGTGAVVLPGARIGRNVVIRDTILMGADFYETPGEIASCRTNGDPPLGVGEGSHIEGAIIDKNARIGRNVRIINEQGLDHTEETPFGMIRDGIVVTAKNTSLPDGWRL